jgi:hypothetical protein
MSTSRGAEAVSNDGPWSVGEARAFVQLFTEAVDSGTTGALALAVRATTPVDAARRYASAGLPVIPWVVVGDAKQPAVKNWPQVATADPEKASRMWDRYPDAGVGIVVDAGWCVLDIDGSRGLTTLLAHVTTGSLPLGPRVRTGRGYHLYFRTPSIAEPVLRNCARGGVEFYVEPRKRFMAAPPSRHPSGAVYAWEHGALPVPELPVSVLSWLLETADPTASEPNVAEPRVGRHDDLFRLLCSMRAQGCANSTIQDAAASENRRFKEGPLPEEELARIVQSVTKYPPGTKRAAILKAAPKTTGRLGGFTLTRYEDIEERPLTWGWRGVFPRRTLSTLVGEPGLGKSLVTCDLAARFSRGDSMPGGGANGFGESVNVLMIAIEDDPADTIKPRLRVAGADMTRIFEARMKVEGADDVGALPTFPDDVPQLFAWVRAHAIKVIIIDPITACLSEDVNAWRDTDVRRALSPLITLARETDAAVIGVMHVNKDETKSAINRVANSKAFTAVPRAVWWLGRDPEDDAHPVMVPVKLNGAKKDRSFGLRLAGFDNETPRVSWDSTPGSLTTNDLEARPAEERRDQRFEAARLLCAHLHVGPTESRVLKEAAKAQGIGDKTLERVAKEMGVVFDRAAEFHARSVWRWPTKPIA